MQKVPTENDLITVTDNFFKLHWNREQHGGNVPVWKPWDFVGTIPFHNQQGCYALLTQKVVLYVGIGIGRSQRRYHGSGLGDRLKNYYKLDKRKGSNISSVEVRYYAPREPYNWVTKILTIGFPTEVDYLSAALEVYLISRLKPTKNYLLK